MRLLSLGLALTFTTAAFAQLPVFPAKNVPETFFGTVVDDPYRALENEKDPEVAQWMKAHAEHARSTLEGVKGYPALLKRVAELDNATAARVGAVQRTRGGEIFYTRRGATENAFKLYVRSAQGRERMLLDPEEWQRKTGRPHAINYFEPSPDGKLVAAGMSAGGNELASLYVIDVASGKQVGEPIDRARYANVNWLPNGRSFFYSRVPQLAPGMPTSELFKNIRTYLHVVGTQPAADKLLLGVDGTSRVPMLPTEGGYIVVTPGSKHALAVVYDGVKREVVLYTTPLERAGDPAAPWTKICDASDKVTDAVVHGEYVYLRTHRDSPRFAVIRTRLAAPDMKAADVVIPAGNRMISAIAAAKDALYVEERDGALKNLKRMPWGSRETSDVRFPVQGAARIFHATPDVDGAVVGVAAWTRALEIFAVDRSGRVANTGLQPLGPFDAPADIVATEVKVRSHDGAMVPLSIMHKKGLKLDGTNPAVMLGYGAYGITYDAGFEPTRLAWLERGGIFAVANVRGSSAYGEDWYKAGYKASKPNTWKDFIACAEYLVAQKYTSSAKLGIIGGSAGGITVGRALTERPDLFGVVMPIVGMLDFVRLHVMPIGPVNVPEFGSTATEAEFRGLLAMSAYHHVKDGTKYPAVLLQHGVNDTRVNVGQSNKMAARLMAASTSGKPVLLDLDYEGGHGQGGTKAQTQRQAAHRYAFMLWQSGDPDFQAAK